MDREQLDRMIAELEKQQEEAARVLPHLRAAREALENRALAADGPQPVKAAKNGHTAKKNLFEPKYKKPGKELIVDLLGGLDTSRRQVGLSRRGVREALDAQGTAFSSQFISFALKQLEEEGVVEKVPAPKEASAKWNFRLNLRHPSGREGV